MVGASIRFLVFGAIFVALLVLVRKSKWVHKKWMTILSAILVLVLWSVSTMFPPENLFLTFPTARSAYYYMNMDHITDVLEGDESCLILSIKGSTTGMEFLPKKSSGYQLSPQNVELGRTIPVPNREDVLLPFIKSITQTIIIFLVIGELRKITNLSCPITRIPSFYSIQQKYPMVL